MKTSFPLVLAVLLTAALAGTATAKPPVPAFESDADPTPQGRIDELVFAKLKQLGIAPAKPCSDGVFVRRVYLDVIGTLPTAEEASQFLNDTDPDKRRKLIDRLLAAGRVRRLLGDEVVRPAAGQVGISHQPVAQRGAGVPPLDPDLPPGEHALRPVRPRDAHRQRQQLPRAARSTSTAPSRARQPQAIAQAVALTLHGSAAREAGRRSGWAGMAAFFSQIGLQADRRNGKRRSSPSIWTRRRRKPPPRRCKRPCFPMERRPDLSPDQDPRKVFADWLITPENPWFARNIVNRVWSWLLGRGIVHEPDDIRPDNPPSNPELLAFLEKELVAAHYDLKQHLPVDSELEDVSAVVRSPRREDPEAAANFAHYPMRRLEAEVLIDALCQITGTTEEYSSLIPEPFTFIPGRSALHRAGRRQHHQPVPRDVRPSAARHRFGIGTQQPSHRRAAAAPAQFEPYPPQDRTRPASWRSLHASPGAIRRRPSSNLYLTILSRCPPKRS